MPKLRTKQNNQRKTPGGGVSPAAWIAHCQAIGVDCDHYPEVGLTQVAFPGLYPYAFQEQAGKPTFRMFETLTATVQFSAAVAAQTPTPTKLVVITYEFLLGVDLRFDTLGAGNLNYHRLLWAVSQASYGNIFGGVSVPVMMTAPDEEQEVQVRVVLNPIPATPAELNSLILSWGPLAVRALKQTADYYFDDDAWADYNKAIVGAGVSVANQRTPALCL